MTLIEKILATHSDKKKVEPGEIVNAKIDVAMVHEITGPLAVDVFSKIKTDKVWDPEKIVVLFDHQIPADTEDSAKLMTKMRKFVKDQKIKNFYDVKAGVCHQVLPEKGHVRPGEIVVGAVFAQKFNKSGDIIWDSTDVIFNYVFISDRTILSDVNGGLIVVGADSHTCTYGAFGALGTGIGSTEMAAVFAKGELWFKVPETIKFNITGERSEYLSGKDIVLKIIGDVGTNGAVYMATEFAGNVVSDMSISDRMTMCNMSIEMGGKVGVVEPDQKTIDYVKNRTKKEFTIQKNDSDAQFTDVLDIDVTDLPPQVAFPHAVDNVKSVEEAQGIHIDQAFIGTCTNGRLEDIEIAAQVLKGKKVHKDVRLIVAPASFEIYLAALKSGAIETLARADAIICNPGCACCLGGHQGVLAPGEVAISASNRTFKGRMGSLESFVYLASPNTVAASAITGEIVDPRNIK